MRAGDSPGDRPSTYAPAHAAPAHLRPIHVSQSCAHCRRTQNRITPHCERVPVGLHTVFNQLEIAQFDRRADLAQEVPPTTRAAPPSMPKAGSLRPLASKR